MLLMSGTVPHEAVELSQKLSAGQTIPCFWPNLMG